MLSANGSDCMASEDSGVESQRNGVVILKQQVGFPVWR